MRIKILIFSLLIVQVAFAQQQLNMSAKVLSFKEPYNKMKIEVTDNSGIETDLFYVTHLSKFLNSSGKEVSLRQFKEGQEYNFTIKKLNNRFELVTAYTGNPDVVDNSEDSENSKTKKGTESFYTGNSTISLGLGIGSSLKPFSSIDKSKIGKSLIWDNKVNRLNLGSIGFLTAGGYFGFKTFKDVLNKKTDKYLNHYTYMSLGARSTFHLQEYVPIERWDPYLGFMYSFNFRFSNIASSDDDKFFTSKFSGFLGSRYYVIKNLAFFLEAGFGINYLNFGLTFNSGLLSQ